MTRDRGWIKSFWDALRPGSPDIEQPNDDERAKRMRDLNAELDVLRAAAFERTRTVEAKASFIVVAAGG